MTTPRPSGPSSRPGPEFGSGSRPGHAPRDDPWTDVATAHGGVADWHADRVIPPGVRDQRLVTIRRGGTLTVANHQLLALWAAA